MKSEALCFERSWAIRDWKAVASKNLDDKLLGLCVPEALSSDRRRWPERSWRATGNNLCDCTIFIGSDLVKITYCFFHYFKHYITSFLYVFLLSLLNTTHLFKIICYHCPWHGNKNASWYRWLFDINGTVSKAEKI